MNVRTHTSTVHAARTHAARTIEVPACMSNAQVGGLHYTIPTADAVTCQRCLANVKTAAPRIARAAAAVKPTQAASATLAFVAGPVVAVRTTDQYGTAWVLHLNGGQAPTFVSLTLKGARAVAAKYADRA